MNTSLVVTTEFNPLVARGFSVWRLHALPMSAWVLSGNVKVRLPAETKASAGIPPRRWLVYLLTTRLSLKTNQILDDV